MKKVLIINLCGLGYEGMTSVILNYSSHISLDDLSLEFVSPGIVDSALKEKFLKIGPVHEVRNRKKDLKGYLEDLKTLLQANHYDVLHIHGNSGTMLIETVLGKFCGVKKTITHCHNTTCNHPVLNRFMTPAMKRMTDCNIACSHQAGVWLYGKSPVIVLNNAIDLENYRFDNTIRQDYRKSLNLDGCYVIGHAGRFARQKNHEFLIAVFEKIYQKNSQARLLLLGDGEKRKEIERLVSDKGLHDAVVFLGRRADMNKLYQAMDVFLLPSRWEGLPVVMLEAQAAGLPVIASDHVTSEAKCAEKVVYKSLEDSVADWADEVLNYADINFDRCEYCIQSIDKLSDRGFDIQKEAAVLAGIYQN